MAKKNQIYLLIGLPLAIISFTLMITGVVLSAGLMVTTLGIPVLAGTLLMARGLADLHRVSLGNVLHRREHVEHDLEAVACKRFGEPPLAQARYADLAVHVADHEFGSPRVRPQDRLEGCQIRQSELAHQSIYRFSHFWLKPFNQASGDPNLLADTIDEEVNIVASYAQTLAVEFEFKDISGSPEMHMHHSVFTIIDANHHTEDWTFMMKDKPMHAHFDLQRKN